MRKYDIMIASILGWTDIAEEDGEWYGKSPSDQYRVMVPKFTIDYATSMELLHLLPRWNIIHTSDGYLVEIDYKPADRLSAAISVAFIANAILSEMNNQPETMEQKLARKELRRNGE